MTTKKESVLKTEERFFLNINNEDLYLDVDIKDFTFKLSIPPISKEAALSLSTIALAKAALGRPEYFELANSVRIPKWERSEEKDENGEEKTVLKDREPNLNNIRDVRYVLTMLPDEFISYLNNMAYLDIIVSEITYKGNPVWVKVDDREVEIKKFNDFCNYVTIKSMRLGNVIDTLIGAYSSWIEEVEIEPDEVKN